MTKEIIEEILMNNDIDIRLFIRYLDDLEESYFIKELE